MRGREAGSRGWDPWGVTRLRLPTRLRRIRRLPGIGVGVAVAVVAFLLIAGGLDESEDPGSSQTAPSERAGDAGPSGIDPSARGGDDVTRAEAAPRDSFDVEAKVLEVIDGDTIVASIAGEEERIRYIGIDTPETDTSGQVGECYAAEATRLNEKLVGGRTVQLEFDEELRDRFGRLLAYVTADGRRVNEELVRSGSATTLTIEPNTARATRLAELETAAGRAGRGLWGAC